jgi:hypothetical protein
MEKLKIHNRLAFKKIDDEILVLDTKVLRQVHQLNSVGARIWELCSGERDEREIAEVISMEFEVTFENALEDVHVFIASLRDRQLLEIVENK